MRANVGDELVVGRTEGSDSRVGKIVAVTGDGAPPYVVHWVVGDYDSSVTPWPGVRIRRRRPLPRPEEKGPGARVVSPWPTAAVV